MNNRILKDGFHMEKDRPLPKSWEPSKKAMKLLTDLYARLKSHDCREGDYYFLMEIVNEALWDKSYGPKLDRKIKRMK